MSHNQNFKNLILDYPRESMRFFAAAEAMQVDQGARILPIREEQLKERLGEQQFQVWAQSGSDSPVPLVQPIVSLLFQGGKGGLLSASLGANPNPPPPPFEKGGEEGDRPRLGRW